MNNKTTVLPQPRTLNPRKQEGKISNDLCLKTLEMPHRKSHGIVAIHRLPWTNVCACQDAECCHWTRAAWGTTI